MKNTAQKETAPDIFSALSGSVRSIRMQESISPPSRLFTGRAFIVASDMLHMAKYDAMSLCGIAFDMIKSNRFTAIPAPSMIISAIYDFACDIRISAPRGYIDMLLISDPHMAAAAICPISCRSAAARVNAVYIERSQAINKSAPSHAKGCICKDGGVRCLLCLSEFEKKRGNLSTSGVADMRIFQRGIIYRDVKLKIFLVYVIINKQINAKH